MQTGEMGELRFEEAARLWFPGKAQTVAPRTAIEYRNYVRGLLRFFRDIKLKDIHIGHIVEFRTERLLRAGPDRVNHECNTLMQIMEPAGLWAPIAKRFKPLRKPRRGPGQRVEEEALRWLIEVASTKTKWRIAYLCTLVEINTACGPSEVLGLRLQDVNFVERAVTFVVGTKTDRDRIRTIPMTDDCFWALRELELIAREKGSCLPLHYLVLGRAKAQGQKPDPTKPATSFKKAWGSLRIEAAKRFPSLRTVRRYDMRHTSATMMAENPDVDLPTLKKVLGHGPFSRLAIEHYFHESMKRKRLCVSTMDGLRKPAKTEKVEPISPQELIN